MKAKPGSFVVQMLRFMALCDAIEKRDIEGATPCFIACVVLIY